MKDESIIPADFWRTVSAAEFSEIIASGTLTKEQIARLWRMTDRQTAMPERLEPLVLREDVMRLWPPQGVSDER